MNCAGVDAGVNNVHKVEVPAAWADAPDDAPRAKMVGRDDLHTSYLNDVLVPTNTLTGDDVPVSTFTATATGLVPAGKLHLKREVSQQTFRSGQKRELYPV